MSNMKKVFGMAKKKSEDFDEDACSYSDPTLIHATEPPPRNARGFSQPVYPPPRPQHSPNPRRKNDEGTTQNNKRTQANDTARNSAVEPRRAPPQRPNVAKKDSSLDDDYCDPVDAQRKEQFQPDLKNKGAKDDYCEPWDTTKKTDFANIPKKSSQSDDEYNEYMDPYDTGREGIIEKRRSRGIGKDFHGKLPPQNMEQRRNTAENTPAVVVHDPRKAQTADDYDTPWEWKKQIQMGKMVAPKPGQQNQRPKPASTAKDDYDEPWENRQGYMLKNPPGGAKTKSPVPVPRVSVNPASQGGHELYEQPWEAPPNNTKHAAGVYETPWEPQKEMNGKTRATSPRRASQPSMPTAPKAPQNRKASHSGVEEVPGDYYDTPWEYKNAKKFPPPGPPKPATMDEEPGVSEINPDLLLDQQGWYHGPLKRLEAEDLLRDSPDCSFLVRNSESSKKDFSLSMKNNDNFLHLKIVRQLDGQFILGQFSKPFMDIPKVIYHYSRNKLNIRGAEHKHLKHPVTSQPEYHIIEPSDDSHL